MKTASVRRTFLSILLCGTLTWTSCSNNWIGEAQKIVDVLIPAAANVMTLIATLQGNISSADLQTARSVGAEVNSDLQLLQSLILQYQGAARTSQQGLLSQIQAALAAVQSDLNALLPVLHINDAATQEKVDALVGIVLSEVQSMATIIPAINEMESSVTFKRMAAVAPGTARIPLSANEFVTSYNSTMVRKTGNARLDRLTSGLRIHAHGKIERWASVGWLN